MVTMNTSNSRSSSISNDVSSGNDDDEAEKGLHRTSQPTSAPFLEEVPADEAAPLPPDVAVDIRGGCHPSESSKEVVAKNKAARTVEFQEERDVNSKENEDLESATLPTASGCCNQEQELPFTSPDSSGRPPQEIEATLVRCSCQRSRLGSQNVVYDAVAVNDVPEVQRNHAEEANRGANINDPPAEPWWWKYCQSFVFKSCLCNVIVALGAIVGAFTTLQMKGGVETGSETNAPVTSTKATFYPGGTATIASPATSEPKKTTVAATDTVGEHSPIPSSEISRTTSAASTTTTIATSHTMSTTRSSDARTTTTDGPDTTTSAPPTAFQSPAVPFNLYFWGDQSHFGENGEYYIRGPTLANKSVIGVSAGYSFSAIILTDGTVQTAGKIDKDYGQLGVVGATRGINPFRNVSIVYDSQSGYVIEPPRFKQVSAGLNHLLLVDDDGHAWGTGSNGYGQLCLSDWIDRMVPFKIAVDGRILEAHASNYHSLLLHENGTVFKCGYLPFDADDSSTPSPKVVEGLGFIEHVSTGIRHVLFLSLDDLRVGGYNSKGFGEHCVNSDDSSISKLSDVNRDEVVSFEATAFSSYILFQNGSVGACGHNMFGQLGDGTHLNKTRTTVLSPVQIKMMGVGPTSYSAFYLGENGILYASGMNDRGQLGVGDTSSKSVPAAVKMNNNVAFDFLSSGKYHTLAMSRTESNQ